MRGVFGEKKRAENFTLAGRIHSRFNRAKIAYAVISAIVYTAFTVVMLIFRWGKSVYLYLIMGFTAAYVLIFAAYMFFVFSKGQRLSRTFKDYKSGLKILKHILTLINLVLTISIFSLSLFGDIRRLDFGLTMIVVSFAWAVFQIFYQSVRLIKRHSKKRR